MLSSLYLRGIFMISSLYFRGIFAVSSCYLHCIFVVSSWYLHDIFIVFSWYLRGIFMLSSLYFRGIFAVSYSWSNIYQQTRRLPRRPRICSCGVALLEQFATFRLVVCITAGIQAWQLKQRFSLARTLKNIFSISPSNMRSPL